MNLQQIEPDSRIVSILHLSTDFARQALYVQLVRVLAKLGIRQMVYVPVRTAGEVDKNRDDEIPDVQWQFSFVLNLWLKVNYFRKIKVVERDILSHFSLTDVQVIHAHFMFSDGGVALSLNKRFNIPYIVAFRNTDLNMYFKYAFHLRRYGLRILLEAKKIVFITPAYKQKLLRQYIPESHHPAIEEKSVVIPNGVDDFWIDSPYREKRSIGNVVRLLYVGEFSKNKNIQGIIGACKKLREKYTLMLTLVGDYGDYRTEIHEMTSQVDFITIHPRVNDRTLLRDLYRMHDVFVMPSFLETFGVVYLEALSQSLPIIFTKGQGIDGYFGEGEVGYGVDPENVSDIADKIDQVILNYDSITARSFNLEQFRWSEIASSYQKIYNEVKG